MRVPHVSPLGTDIQDSAGADAPAGDLAFSVPCVSAKQAKGMYVLPGIPPRPIAFYSIPLLRLRRWYRRSSLRLLLHDLHSLPYRMGWTLEIYEAGRLRGKVEVRRWAEGCAVGGPYTHEYILYMQQIEDKYPFLSLFDRLLLTEAWKAGSVSGVPLDKRHDRVESIS